MMMFYVPALCNEIAQNSLLPCIKGRQAGAMEEAQNIV